MTIATEIDYMALGSRTASTEMWDGNMLVRPRETPRHELCVSAIAGALRVGLNGLHVLSGMAVRLAPGRVALPDLVIARVTDLDKPILDAEDVKLICEIVSPASAVMDRVLKMHGYAEAGIPCYLVAEPEAGALRSHQLSDGSYVPGPVMQLVQVTNGLFGPA
jgi:hypothetical protein